MPKIMNR